ncbi:MAG: transposase, partial [Zoogloeaceae bacterium]|nr:transposase [Zoogloeaceae bacterium]
MTAWAMEEFGGASLGDKRLNARLIKLATRF